MLMIRILIYLFVAVVMVGCDKEPGNSENDNTPIPHDGEIIDALVSPFKSLRWGASPAEVSEVISLHGYKFDRTIGEDQFYTYGEYNILQYDEARRFDVTEIWGFNFDKGGLREFIYYVPASDWWTMQYRWMQMANQMGPPFSDRMALGVGLGGDVITANCRIQSVSTGSDLCNKTSETFRALCPEKHRQSYREFFIVWSVR